jgi:hypothetical protein
MIGWLYPAFDFLGGCAIFLQGQSLHLITPPPW